MSDLPPPLEPIAFREACVALLLHWEDVGEPGEAVDDALAHEWFQERLGDRNVDVAAATLRFLETMDALEDAPLCEFVASVGEDFEELPMAVFESAARAPMSEDGKLDVDWIARDLLRRLQEIAVVERLLGEGPSDSHPD